MLMNAVSAQKSCTFDVVGSHAPVADAAQIVARVDGANVPNDANN